MKFNLMILSSICCTLLYGNVLANKIKTLDEKNTATQEVFDAVEEGNLETIKSLIEDPYFKEILRKKDEKRRSVFEIAIQNGHDEVVKFLLDNTPRGTFNLNALTASHKPVLIIAVENGHDDVVETLLDHSAIPDAVDASAEGLQKTALILATEQNSYDMVSSLLNHKAKPNKKDIVGRTALMIASRKGLTDIVKLLLENDADPNLENTEKETALSNAVEAVDVNIVKLLLENGAKVSKQVLTYTEKINNQKIINLLKKYREEQKDKKLANRIWNKLKGKKRKKTIMPADSDQTLYEENETDESEQTFDDSNDEE